MAKRPAADLMVESPVKVPRLPTVAAEEVHVMRSRFGDAAEDKVRIKASPVDSVAPLQVPIKAAPVTGGRVLNEHHALLTAANMRRQSMDKFTDVTVEVGDKKYHCHKLILCAASPTLEERLTGRQAGIKDEKNAVTLNFAAECWEAASRFMYEGHTELATVDFALRLLECAKELRLDNLVAKIVGYLLLSMDDANVYIIMQHSYVHHLDALYAQAKARITSGALRRICAAPAFYDFFPKLVEDLVASLNAQVQSELDIFEVAKTWLIYGCAGIVQNRKHRVTEMLSSYLDLGKLNSHELALLHRDALAVGLRAFAQLVQAKQLGGICAHLPSITPAYRLSYPRMLKTLSFTYRLSGVSVLNELYGASASAHSGANADADICAGTGTDKGTGKGMDEGGGGGGGGGGGLGVGGISGAGGGGGTNMSGNWHRDSFGHFWRLAVSVEDIDKQNFLGVFLQFRAPQKPADAKTTVTFQCFVVKNEGYEAVNVRERTSHFDMSDDKSRQGWREFLAFDKIKGEDGYADQQSDAVTFGATIYFGQ